VRTDKVVWRFDGQSYCCCGGEENGPTPTGRVKFLYGWNSFEIERLANGSVTIETKLPDNQDLPLRAIYLGDGNYNSAGSVDDSQSQSCSRN
jgi:hypothetical protein